MIVLIRYLFCTELEVLKVPTAPFVFQFIQSAGGRLLNKSRTLVCRPRGSSRYNLKIRSPAGSFPPTELRPRMLQSYFRRRYHCRT